MSSGFAERPRGPRRPGGPLPRRSRLQPHKQRAVANNTRITSAHTRQGRAHRKTYWTGYPKHSSNEGDMAHRKTYWTAYPKHSSNEGDMAHRKTYWTAYPKHSSNEGDMAHRKT